MKGDLGLSVLQTLHADCECTIESQPNITGTSLLSKDTCDVSIENLIIAIDCDRCKAFTENDTRPDVVAIRRCHDDDEWLVLEMKSTMRIHAAQQVKAGLSRLGNDPLFVLQLQTVQIFFVIKNRRKADNTIMRQIGRIEVGPWAVVPRLLRSGQAILCDVTITKSG